MGSCLRTSQKCSRSSSPPPLWPQLSPLDPQLMVPLPHTSRRSSPLSHMPTNTELLMTTARPTSRRPRHRMPTVLLGSFVIALPDGRIQTTKYTADHVNGFVADVTYEGTPVYPPEPKEGYGHAPAYKAPAPAYHA